MATVNDNIKTKELRWYSFPLKLRTDGGQITVHFHNTHGAGWKADRQLAERTDIRLMDSRRNGYIVVRLSKTRMD